jgi:hypothetical protein
MAFYQLLGVLLCKTKDMNNFLYADLLKVTEKNSNFVYAFEIPLSGQF